jgi:hypothetical protein
VVADEAAVTIVGDGAAERRHATMGRVRSAGSVLEE